MDLLLDSSDNERDPEITVEHAAKSVRASRADRAEEQQQLNRVVEERADEGSARKGHAELEILAHKHAPKKKEGETAPSMNLPKDTARRREDSDTENSNKRKESYVVDTAKMGGLVDMYDHTDAISVYDSEDEILETPVKKPRFTAVDLSDEPDEDADQAFATAQALGVSLQEAASILSVQKQLLEAAHQNQNTAASSRSDEALARHMQEESCLSLPPAVHDDAAFARRLHEEQVSGSRGSWSSSTDLDLEIGINGEVVRWMTPVNEG